MKVWVSKYALTTLGIYSVDAEQVDQDMVCVNRVYGSDYYYGEGKEWHRTPQDAVKRADDMRRRQIASLRKRIAKLEAMRFDA